MDELDEFIDRLFSWYETHKRDLPWRDDPSPYEVWISEVMLQQTTVPAIEGRFEQWMERFPTIETVAEASEQDILAEWEGLGYYQRASRLHAAARQVVKEHAGQLPRAEDKLRDLPGVGPYIASAIRSIAFGADVIALDANLSRVFMRLLAIRGRPGVSAVRDQVREAAQRVLPEGDSSRFNQSLMDFGSIVCRPSDPDCGHCFATDLCAAFQKGLQEDIPERRRKKIKKIDTAVAIFIRDSHVYIQRRPPDGLFAGMWEFPGGKLEEGETPGEAVKREVQEELGVDSTVREKVTSFVHYYTRFEVTLHAFICKTEGTLIDNETHRWVELSDLNDYPMPSANRTLVGELRGIVEDG